MRGRPAAEGRRCRGRRRNAECGRRDGARPRGRRSADWTAISQPWRTADCGLRTADRGPRSARARGLHRLRAPGNRRRRSGHGGAPLPAHFADSGVRRGGRHRGGRPADPAPRRRRRARTDVPHRLRRQLHRRPSRPDDPSPSPSTNRGASPARCSWTPWSTERRPNLNRVSTPASCCAARPARCAAPRGERVRGTAPPSEAGRRRRGRASRSAVRWCRRCRTGRRPGPRCPGFRGPGR